MITPEGQWKKKRQLKVHSVPGLYLECSEAPQKKIPRTSVIQVCPNLKLCIYQNVEENRFF